MDFKIAQDFTIKAGGKDHTLQLTLDVFNFTNMINKNWGRRYFVGNNIFPLIQANRVNPTTVEYNFTDPKEPYTIVQSGTYSARWNAQFGVRYSF